MFRYRTHQVFRTREICIRVIMGLGHYPKKAFYGKNIHVLRGWANREVSRFEAREFPRDQILQNLNQQ